MNFQSLTPTIRAVLQVVAGVLVSRGLVKGGDVEQYIGAVIAILSIIWSHYEKKQIVEKTEAKVIAEVTNTPVPKP